MANNRLSWGKMKMEYHDYIPNDQIIEQDPKAGTLSGEDKLVNVTVSKGKKLDEPITSSENYKNTASNNNESNNNFDKDSQYICFARMRKIVLALLYADKKLNKRVNYYDANELVKIGALYSVPVCPDQGCYSVEVIENGRRQIKCSVHGILKNEVLVNQTKPEPKRNAKILSLGRITAKSGLNLRSEPTTKSGKVGSIAFGTDVILLEKSIKDTIENVTSNWYQAMSLS